MSHIEQLISLYLDEMLSEEQQHELEAWINSDPENARQFADAVHFDNRLQAELAANEFKTPAENQRPVDSISRGEHRSWTLGISVLAIAAILLAIGLTQWSGSDEDQPKQIAGDAPPSFVTVAQVADPVLTGEGSLVADQRLASGIVNLKSGLARLTFDDGVEVTLRGPVEYELVSLGQTRLISGTLTATVPKGAEGFRVATPGGEVIDLGTSFGVHVDDAGVSDVLVFEGEVEVVGDHAASKRLVVEGESVQLGNEGEVSENEFDASRFERLWPLASGIAGSDEVFGFVPPWPRRMHFVTSDDNIFIAPEGHAVRLGSDLKVDISEPGEYEVMDDLTPSVLHPRQRVRSYVLHYQPTTQINPRRAKRVSGSITFDRPIVGLIVRHEQLLASSRRFIRRAAGERQPRRQLEFTGGGDGDRVSISEDRRTLTVDLISPGRSSDLIRVIVEAPRPRRARRSRAAKTE